MIDWLGICRASVEDVRQGKYIEVEIKESDRKKAEATVEKMCAGLLANTVIFAHTPVANAMSTRVHHFEMQQFIPPTVPPTPTTAPSPTPSPAPTNTPKPAE